MILINRSVREIGFFAIFLFPLRLTKESSGRKIRLTGLPAVIAYVRELLFLLYCPFEGVKRAAYGYRIVIDHQKSGVFQKVVVTAQETALGISVLQGYHFIGLRQNGVVTLLVGLGVPFGLSLEGDNAFQTGYAGIFF